MREHFAFARAQPAFGRELPSGPRCRRLRFGQGDAGRERSYPFHEVLCGPIFRHDAVASGGPRGRQRRFVAEARHDQHERIRRDDLQLRNTRRCIAVGQPIIEQHDVGSVRPDLTNRLFDGVRQA